MTGFEECPYRIGLRVPDVAEAAAFYEGLGFRPIGEIPGPDGRAVMVILRRGNLQLLVDALVGMPFADTPRERRTKAGVRGLGVVIGLAVDDVDAVSRYCANNGCEVTTEPVDAPFGERYAECVDPSGYAWKFFHVLPEQSSDSLTAARESWF